MDQPDPDPIGLISMACSMSGILIIGVSWVIARNSLQAQEYYSMEFEVTEPSISSNAKKYRTNIKTIKYEICKILSADEKSVEITRPIEIKDGLRLHINLFNLYGNKIDTKDLDPEKTIMNAHDSGELRDIIKNAWGLPTVPVISNFKSGNLVEMIPLPSNTPTHEMGPGFHQGIERPHQEKYGDDIEKGKW